VKKVWNASLQNESGRVGLGCLLFAVQRRAQGDRYGVDAVVPELPEDLPRIGDVDAEFVVDGLDSLRAVGSRDEDARLRRVR